MKFTYYGQSTVLIETAGRKILFGPFITPNPLAKAIDINSIKADFIFITHGHGDHVADLVAIGKNSGATILLIGYNYTMGYKDASAAAEFVQTKRVIGLHYGTFPAIAIDHEAAQNAFSNKGIELLLPQIGETIEV